MFHGIRKTQRMVTRELVLRSANQKQSHCDGYAPLRVIIGGGAEG